MEEADLEGQEVTNKYLSGELSFSEYVGLLNTEEDDEELLELEADNESGSRDDQMDTSDANTEAKQVVGEADSTAEIGSEEVEETSKPPQKRKFRRRTLPAVLMSMMGEANLRYARGDKEDAESICKEIIRQCPLAPEPYHLLAMVHEERGDAGRAVQYSLIAAHLSPPDVDEWLRLANISEQQHNHKQLFTCLNNAVRAAPKRLDLHMRRLQAWKAAGRGGRSVAFSLKHSVAVMCQVGPTEAFKMMKELHHVLLAAQLYTDAKDQWNRVFASHGHAASWEDTHIYLELLLTTGAPLECVRALVAFCGVRFTPELPAAAAAPEAALVALLRAADAVHVPDGVPLDVKYKLLLALVHLDCLPLAKRTLIPSLMACDRETYGDIYLDVAEAMMEMQQFEEALSLLTPLTDTRNFSLAAVWLRVGECHNELARAEQAVQAYEKVVQLAPHHSEARLVLSQLLQRLGRREQAIAVLSQEEQKEVLDSELLLKKCDLLEKEGLTEEFIATVRTLLSQHCPIIRTRDEAKSMLVTFRARESQLKQMRKQKFDSSVQEPTFVERPTDPDRHWQLLRKCLILLEERSRHADVVDLIIRAKGSREFESRADIAKNLDTMCAIGCFKAGDYEIGFPVVRKILLADPEVPALWNLLNLVTMRAEDIRHARFLMRLTQRLPELVALSLLNGHNCLMSGTYKYALVEYASAYKLAPDDPLIALLIGVTFIHLAAQKFTVRKHSLVVQAQAFLGLYASLRGDTQESCFNMGRGMHELGLLPNAVHYYRRALELEPPGGDGSLDLRRETAYNLALIYQHSGNTTLARRVIHQYCVI